MRENEYGISGHLHIFAFLKHLMVPKAEWSQVSLSSASPIRISEKRDNDQRIHSTTVETTQSNLIEGKSDSTQGMWK